MNFDQWQTEKHKCLTCRYSIVEDDPQQDKPGTIIRCMWHDIYAIDAREEDKCGLEAKHWKCQPTDLPG